MEGSKLSEEGPVLITHWGLSGPAVLRLSAWGARELALKAYLFKVHIDWLPHETDQTFESHVSKLRTHAAAQKIGNYNGFFYRTACGSSFWNRPNQRPTPLCRFACKAENALSGS
jgi:hypothetical protein